MGRSFPALLFHLSGGRHLGCRVFIGMTPVVTLQMRTNGSRRRSFGETKSQNEGQYLIDYKEAAIPSTQCDRWQLLRTTKNKSLEFSGGILN